jgi:hypothetical protein
LGSGVQDFFYEPVKGWVKSPHDFGRGLQRGTISLLKMSFSSIFAAAGKMTGSVSKAVAYISVSHVKFIHA